MCLWDSFESVVLAVLLYGWKGRIGENELLTVSFFFVIPESVVVRPTVNTVYRNSTLSRSSLGDVGGAPSEGSGRSLGSARSTGSGRSSPQHAASNSNIGSASPTGSGRSSPQHGASNSNIGSVPSTGSGRSSPQHAALNFNVGSALPTASGWSGGSGRSPPRQAASKSKTVWVWTKSKDVMMASVEGGWSIFIFTPETMDLAHEWTCRCSLLFTLLRAGLLYLVVKKSCSS